eukprot:jgi/Tetstr1/458874/TSEL_004382.t1
MSNARLREALNAGGPGTGKDKGPPVADGVLSVTPDTPEAAEWRSRQSAIDFPSSSSTYLEDDDDGSVAAKPADLYGKFTWKIENFSDISKRELRSNIFEVGNYKWYILVYPQGCDVCNHLSLFLCVADYDKLLPGWSHFAQFTIAVVNKDPKKSKYSDTLHRFCKKEHDWGWKKFMELSKVLDGFTVADTLVIKAQVQVIKDRVARPFRCLDPQYRRELVRVYLTNVEGICRRFVEDRRERLAMVRENPENFRQFWQELQKRQKERLTQEKCDTILKGVVKRFFNEKEVTSTLVMDALYSGCRAMEEHTRQWLEHSKKVGPVEPDAEVEQPSVLIHAEKGIFALGDTVLDALERAANESIPPFRDDKCSDGLCGRNQGEEDYGKDSVDRDERRLAELGRRTVEMFVLSHVYTESLEVSYREAESLKRQEALIKEEEEQERLEDERTQARQAVEKERKNRKKERKAKAKAKKDAEDAERKRQEDEARAAAEAKSRAAAEKRRVEEEARAAQDKERLAAAGKRQAQADSTAPQSSGAAGKKAAAPSGGKSAPAPPDKAPPERVLEKAASNSRPADPAPARAPAEPTRDGPAEAPSPPAAAPAPPPHDSPPSSSRKAPEKSRAAAPAPEASRAQPPGKEGLSEEKDEVARLKEQLRSMQRLLAERDAEICALRAQLSELGGAKPEAAPSDSAKSGSGSLPRSSSGSQLEADAPAPPKPPSRPASRDGSVGGGGADGATATAGLAGAARGAQLSEGASSAQQAYPDGEMRSGGRNVKRGLGGKYAVQVATAAAAAALHSRQSPSNGAPSAAAAGQQLPTSGGSRSEAARTPSGQTSQPAQPPPGGARQQLNGRMGVSAAQQAARQVVPSSSAPSSQSVPQSPPPPVYPAGGGSHGSIAGNGMMAVPTSSAPAAVINGVPSYRNAAMGQVAEGAPPASGVAPPPPPPVPLSPTSSISGKEHPHQADAGEAPYQHIMMHQQLHPPASASLAGHFATPPVNNKPQGPNMRGSSSAESPGLDDFAHMGLINDLLE